MTTIARPEVLQAQQRFRALLDALAHPGRQVQIDAGDGADAVTRYPHAIAETLLDHEVSFAIVGDGLHPADARRFAEEVRLHTGAVPADARLADFVFVFGSPGGTLHDLRTGDLVFPDRAATLVWRVFGFAGGTSASLSGPGIDGETTASLAGVDRKDLQALAMINAAYPCGLDVFFVDGGGSVLGLPRSTRIGLAAGSAGQTVEV